MSQKDKYSEKVSSFLFGRDFKDPARLLNLIVSDTEVDLKDMILSNDDMLVKIGSMWENNQDAIEQVIKVRVLGILYDMCINNEPEEVVVSRQSLLDLMAVLEDFVTYHQEYQKRQQKKDYRVKKGEEKEEKEKKEDLSSL